MFYPKKMSGNLRSWEEFPAKAGSYMAGQLLTIADGLLAPLDGASTTTPPYLCQTDRTVTEGETIPVVRVSYDTIYETSLSADAADAKIGTMLQVSAGGKQADAGAEGSFEVVYIEDTAAGSVVQGRFHASSGAGAANIEVATNQEVSDTIEETFKEGE